MQFEGLMQDPVYRVQCRTWRKAVAHNLCSADFRALPQYRSTLARHSRKLVAKMVRAERKTSGGRFIRRRFFDLVFQSNVPARLREFAEWFCATANINGTADPMYVSNVVAADFGLGDGKGHFFVEPRRLESGLEETVKTVARRLRFAYCACLAAHPIDDEALADALFQAVTP